MTTRPAAEEKELAVDPEELGEQDPERAAQEEARRAPQLSWPFAQRAKLIPFELPPEWKQFSSRATYNLIRKVLAMAM